MTTMLKPGFLVSLKTSVSGGIFYKRVDLEAKAGEEATIDQMVADADAAAKAADVSKWETTRTIQDPEEYARAQKTRSAAAALIRGACIHTAFGLLCPKDREGKLDEAIKEAQELVANYNASASASTIAIYTIRGYIASTDEEAVRSLSAEVRELLNEMETGIRGVDVEAIREAASKAKRLGALLSEDQAKQVSAAVEAARDAAKVIVKRLETEGVEAVRVAAEGLSGPIEKARFSFIEAEERMAETVSMPAINVQRVADLELDESDTPSAPVVAHRPELELQ